MRVRNYPHTHTHIPYFLGESSLCRSTRTLIHTHIDTDRHTQTFSLLVQVNPVYCHEYNITQEGHTFISTYIS